MTKIACGLFLLAWLGACSSDTPAKRATAATTPPAPSVAPTVSKAAPQPADTLATFVWEDDVCRYSGRYNPRKYTREQLENVRLLLYGSASLETSGLVHHPRNIGRLSLDTLTREYTRRMPVYRAMQVVNQPVWRTLKSQAIREMEEDYQAKKLSIQAYADPAVLLTTAYPSSCTRYVQGLAAHDDSLTLRDWHSFIQERIRREKKLSGGPEHYTQRYAEQQASPDRLLFAKVDLLTYGWWNCINESIHRVEQTAELHKQFRQLFSSVKSECDEV
ncbi:hypothetical protein [Hymenobacter cellulosilyticus]|uniref:DUF4294 domain-containing protein n=1 Tax=Hymenobacter cellulosilyticus TaxID=2932248 RepID=A0A8T9QDD8_9BACT|nr:hypothetical protein [Hymenobacter cellulosilyticus]UOQ74922.1 hypothetical protein MUN79_14260 [Hymenobacter cellulosilyticus]